MDEVTQAHAKLLHDTAIQFGFPAAAPLPPPPEAPAGLPFSLGDGSALFWIVIAVAIVGIALVLVQHLRTRRRERRPQAPAGARPGRGPVAIPAVAMPPAALDEADGLAGQGRYGDAVHALLLRGVAALDRQFPRALAPSATSRDIARLPALPDATRQAFAGIAQRTERAVFARATLARHDWEACRALYATLVPAAAKR